MYIFVCVLYGIYTYKNICMHYYAFTSMYRSNSGRSNGLHALDTRDLPKGLPLLGCLDVLAWDVLVIPQQMSRKESTPQATGAYYLSNKTSEIWSSQLSSSLQPAIHAPIFPKAWYHPLSPSHLPQAVPGGGCLATQHEQQPSPCTKNVYTISRWSLTSNDAACWHASNHQYCLRPLRL